MQTFKSSLRYYKAVQIYNKTPHIIKDETGDKYLYSVKIKLFLYYIESIKLQYPFQGYVLKS